jgi:hypothetical protein
MGTDSEAHGLDETIWARHRADLQAGLFWADRIKALRHAPDERLSLALSNLPLPAAFREAAVALRSSIRARRKCGESYESELELLYKLAAIRSFMLDYAPALQSPGFNVMSSIPGGMVASLPYTYLELGYEKLAILNSTDRRWLVEKWGEPSGHTTLNLLHRPVWDEYEQKLIQEREAESALASEKWRRLLGVNHERTTSPPEPQNS